MTKPRNNPLILTPGPVSPPSFVMEAIAQTVIHQRSDAFVEFFTDLQKDLGYLFQTQYPVLSFPGTGTHAVEMALFSCFSEGDRVLVLDNGKFSHRWEVFARSWLDVVSLSSEWGQQIGMERLKKRLKEEKTGFKGVVITHCETSTGVEEDLEEMALMVRELAPGALVVVDAVSSLGALPLYIDAWGLDVVAGASQKGLMNPAGIGFVSLSPQAQARMSNSKGGAAFHLQPYLEYLKDGSYPYTPPTQMLYGIKAAAAAIRSEGLPRRWNRVHSLSQYFKKGVIELGGKLFGEANSDALTVFELPGRECESIKTALMQEHFIEIAGGQGHLNGKILRVGHFGPIVMNDIQSCLSALQQTLS